MVCSKLLLNIDILAMLDFRHTQYERKLESRKDLLLTLGLIQIFLLHVSVFSKLSKMAGCMILGLHCVFWVQLRPMFKRMRVAMVFQNVCMTSRTLIVVETTQPSGGPGTPKVRKNNNKVVSESTKTDQCQQEKYAVESSWNDLHLFSIRSVALIPIHVSCWVYSLSSVNVYNLSKFMEDRFLNQELEERTKS